MGAGRRCSVAGVGEINRISEQNIHEDLEYDMLSRGIRTTSSYHALSE